MGHETLERLWIRRRKIEINPGGYQQPLAILFDRIEGCVVFSISFVHLSSCNGETPGASHNTVYFSGIDELDAGSTLRRNLRPTIHRRE